jgi:hypothetical protein
MALSPFRGKCSDLSANLLSLGPKDQGNIFGSSRPERRAGGHYKQGYAFVVALAVALRHDAVKELRQCS